MWRSRSRASPSSTCWAGDADDGGRAWQRDTLVNVYSTTKTMAATCVLMLADRGEIDLSTPVADYWPEFKANGKEGVLVSHVMSHTAGLSGFDPAIAPTDLYDWGSVCDHLAAQRPRWEPGTASGYHAVTQGFLQGELVRRISGRTIGTFFREEVAEPLGADFHIGLAASEDDRAADLVPPVGSLADLGALDPDSIAARTLLSCPVNGGEPRTREWRGAEIPAAGGTGNARSVARVHSALACGGEVDGVRLMAPEAVERALDEQSHRTDLVLGLPVRYGMGFGPCHRDGVDLAAGRRPLKATSRSSAPASSGGATGSAKLTPSRVAGVRTWRANEATSASSSGGGSRERPMVVARSHECMSRSNATYRKNASPAMVPTGRGSGRSIAPGWWAAAPKRATASLNAAAGSSPIASGRRPEMSCTGSPPSAAVNMVAPPTRWLSRSRVLHRAHGVDSDICSGRTSATSPPRVGTMISSWVAGSMSISSSWVDPPAVIRSPPQPAAAILASMWSSTSVCSRWGLNITTSAASSTRTE